CSTAFTAASRTAMEMRSRSSSVKPALPAIWTAASSAVFTLSSVESRVYETRLPVVFKVSYQARPEILSPWRPCRRWRKTASLPVRTVKSQRVQICSQAAAGPTVPDKLLSDVGQEHDVSTVLAA